MATPKIIIGIHGLGNKPPADLLESWWKKALREGFRRIGESEYLFKFELVYWADVLHPTPLRFEANDTDNTGTLHEPYFPTPYKRREETRSLRKKILDYVEKQLDKLYLKEDRTIDLGKISDKIIHRYFEDLEIYYSSTYAPKLKEGYLAKEVIRKRLFKILHKYRKDEIMLIAHSMGTIVSYDVLTGLAKDIDIDTLVTIGSPLGIPIVMEKIAMEQNIDVKKQKSLYTPENIRNGWYNFSDLHDKVAFNYNLGDDYRANSSKIVPVDSVVYNDYEINDERNPHKSYGYLRTPELSRVVFDFLTRGKSDFSISINKKVASIFYKK
jgi:hypothetical protein